MSLPGPCREIEVVPTKQPEKLPEPAEEPVPSEEPAEEPAPSETPAEPTEVPA